MNRIILALLCAALATPAIAQKKPTPEARPAAADEHPSLTAVAATKPKLTQAQATSNPLAVIQTFTLTDLQNALQLAQSQVPPDTIAINCYQALITIVQTQTGSPAPTVSGAFSAFQEGRDVAAFLTNLQSTNGPLSSLNIACAPLLISAQNTLIQLGILVGLVIPKVPIP